MGLRISHGPGFHVMCKEFAKASNFPDLGLMEGYYVPTTDGNDPEGLPIPWDYFAQDALTVLFRYDDDMGRIDSSDCLPLAARMRGLLDEVSEYDFVEAGREAALDFIRALAEAGLAGEDLVLQPRIQFGEQLRAMGSDLVLGEIFRRGQDDPR